MGEVRQAPELDGFPVELVRGYTVIPGSRKSFPSPDFRISRHKVENAGWGLGEASGGGLGGATWDVLGKGGGEGLQCTVGCVL